VISALTLVLVVGSEIIVCIERSMLDQTLTKWTGKLFNGLLVKTLCVSFVELRHELEVLLGVVSDRVWDYEVLLGNKILRNVVFI